VVDSYLEAGWEDLGMAVMIRVPLHFVLLEKARVRWENYLEEAFALQN
jgi:hypothetical protein